jgi:hypothetical protein
MWIKHFSNPFGNNNLARKIKKASPPPVWPFCKRFRRKFSSQIDNRAIVHWIKEKKRRAPLFEDL